jgi:glutaminase
MSIIAATLANGGVNPLTNERILQTSTVKEVLSIMNSCGMYDYSGEFAFYVGLPAKSGVSGGVMIIVPGIMGICTYAPKLDKYGNSARGVQFCKLISQKFGLHYFNIDQTQSLTNKRSRKNNITQELLHFCGLGDLKGIKSLMMENEIDLDIGDYDGRTALHLACSEGQDKVVEYLLKNGVTNINPTDRWGNTPLDDAIRGKFEKIIENMRAYRARTGEESKRI